MNETQLREVLQTLAHALVRNEILFEYFLASLKISPDAIGAKAREVDAELHEHTDWQNRFPGLFTD